MRELVPPLGGRAWRLLGGFALASLGIGLTLPFLIIYLNEVRGFPLPTAGVILAAVSVGGVLTVLSGGAIDRFGAARVAAVGLLVWSIGLLGLAAATEPFLAAFAALFNGVGFGCVWNSLAALYGEAVRPEQRSNVFGVNYATQNLGLGLGAAIAGSSIDPSVPSTFERMFLANVVCLLLFAGLLLVTDELRVGGQHAALGPRGGYRAVLADRALLGATGVNTLLVIVGFGQLTSAFPAWASQTVPSATTVIGWAWTANTFTIALSQLVVLRLIGGRRRTRTTAGAALLFGTAWLLALVGGLAGGGAGSVTLVLALAVFGVGETLLSPSLPPMVNDLAPSALRGRYNALYNVSWQGGQVLGPPVAGAALGAGLGAPYFVALTACCWLAAGLAIGLEAIVPRAANTSAGV